MDNISDNQIHKPETPEFRARIKKKLDQGLEKTSRSVPGFFIRNYRFTYMIILIILAAGFYSLFTLPREAEPEVRVPFAVVTTIYPGANPTDVEDLITDKIEEEIKNLEDLKIYTSSSGQGFSSVFVEYEAEADLKESFRKLREAVDEAEPKLPEDAESPVVNEVNFNDFPIVTFSLVGGYDDVELKRYADLMQQELESVRDVSRVEILGGLEREFQVIADQTKMASFNISLGQIVNAIRISNLSLPAGDIEVDGFKYNVRVKGRFQEAAELNDIVIATYDDSPVRLSDVARTIDGFEERESESRIGFPGEAPQNTISLQVYKKTGGNILNIVSDSQDRIDELFNGGALPAGLKIEKTNDNSVFIKNDIRTLGTSGLQTMVLITLILMLILSFRGALITALAVPIAFLMSFIFLNLQGLTLNSMVLFALVLSLGLMVDNAIIIIEGINEYISRHNKSVMQAALLSVWNFKWPITAGTLTTVAAFAPQLLVSGILGEYMSILPKTITVTLLSSLFVAIIVIPTLAARFIKINNSHGQGHRDKRRHQAISGFFQKLYVRYTALMKNILASAKKRRLVIASAWILFVLAIATPAVGIMKIEMFPPIDIDYFVVNIELPIGSSLDKTEKVTEATEAIIAELPEMKNYVTNIGASGALGYGESGSSGTYLANITVNLVDKDERGRTSYQITEDIRPRLEAVQGGEVKAEELQAGPPTGAPVEVRIYGDDLSNLDSAARKYIEILEAIPGTVNVRDTIEDASGEFTFSVDKQQANYYGLSISEVAATLRNAIFGTTGSTVNIDGDDVDIVVKYDQEKFTDVNDLENILLFTPGGGNIPVKQIAQVELEPSLLTIRHRDGDKVVFVRSDLETGANLQDVLDEFEAGRQAVGLPEGVNVEIGGEVEDIEQSFREVFLSLIVAIILIAMILVLQFNSFKQPFIIIFSLPLAVIGVIVGLNLFRQPFSLPAFIGIVSLSGIVVNDAIVLIDRINKNIKDGMDFNDAIIEGGVARMQPIFLTSLTTIAGIFPLLYADELWRGLSLTVISGLVFSTVLILVIVPLFYAGLCRREKCVTIKK